MDQAYINAYELYTGKSTYDDLAERGVCFYLPQNHEDRDTLLRYFESLEEYEICQEILEAGE